MFVAQSNCIYVGTHKDGGITRQHLVRGGIDMLPELKILLLFAVKLAESLSSLFTLITNLKICPVTLVIIQWRWHYYNTIKAMFIFCIYFIRHVIINNQVYLPAGKVRTISVALL